MGELDFGIKIEEEHDTTYDFLNKSIKKKGRLPSKKEFFRKIAKDHLKEDANYYKKLGVCGL